MADFDLCIVGSGAGAGPVALTCAAAGYSVVVLEKGPWFTAADFTKDELACCQRSVYTPRLADEQHVIEEEDRAGGWQATPTAESGWNFWNGNCVGGSSNFMSGFFYRLKPVDLRLRSTFGPIAGAEVVDWPIAYAELEPYYAKVEEIVGISGRVVDHPFAEPRSTADFPYPPTAEHPIAARFDTVTASLGLHPLPTPRAVLPHAALGRDGCAYSGYCGSYGCATGAKGSARAALLDKAIATGRCTIRAHAKVTHLESDATGQVTGAAYVDRAGVRQQVTARLYVVACQAIETSRLLLLSRGPRHPNGLANNHGQVGRNLLFSAGGSGGGDLVYAGLSPAAAADLREVGPFVNRGLQDWYEVDAPSLGGRVKGGTIDFLFEHPNAIVRANHLKWSDDGRLLWGSALKRRLKAAFTESRRFRFEVFCDWLPHPDCHVRLDPMVRDRWGSPVARVRVGHHPHDVAIGRLLAERAEGILRALGAKQVASSTTGAPPTNLQAGGCRFGLDPATSVLDPDCRAHDVDNLYVTDGSFMPTGGSVPYTWTIYANALRVADRIVARLGGDRASPRTEESAKTRA